MKKTLFSLLILATFIGCQKENTSPNSNNTTTDKSLINPPQKYWGDYYSKTSLGTYVLIVTISKEDIVYLKESLTLKYKNYGLTESIGNQYVLTTTFSASQMLNDFHNYKTWVLNDSMIEFYAKTNGVANWVLVKK